MLSALSVNFILTFPLLGLNPILIHHVAHQISKQETIIVGAVLADAQQGLPWSFQWLSECTALFAFPPPPTFCFSPPPRAQLEGMAAAATSSN
jgi:hypothetical protein